MPNCVLMSSSCVLPFALRVSSADRRLERCTQFEPNVSLPEVAWARQVRQESNHEANTAPLLGTLQVRSGDPVIQDCLLSDIQAVGAGPRVDWPAWTNQDRQDACARPTA